MIFFLFFGIIEHILTKYDMRLDNKKAILIKAGYLKFLDSFIEARKICFNDIGDTEIPIKEIKKFNQKILNLFISALKRKKIIARYTKNNKFLILDSNFTYKQIKKYKTGLIIPGSYGLIVETKNFDNIWMLHQGTDKEVKLSHMEGKLLFFLYQNKNEAISREEIKNAFQMNNTQISGAIYSIRKKMVKFLNYTKEEAEDMLTPYSHKILSLKIFY